MVFTFNQLIYNVCLFFCSSVRNSIELIALILENLNQLPSNCLFIVSILFCHLSNRSENEDAESDDRVICCKVCKCCTPCYASAICLPCRRLKKLSCCNRSKKPTDKEKNSITTSIINESEIKATTKADSCWKRIRCCNRKSKQVQKEIMDEMTAMEEQTIKAAKSNVIKKREKCSLCLAKIFCCRSLNKVRSSGDMNMNTTDSDDESRGCCSCFSCCRCKKKKPKAWSERQPDSLDQIPKR